MTKDFSLKHSKDIDIQIKSRIIPTKLLNTVFNSLINVATI